MDTRVYEVGFYDGEVRKYAANIIAENIFARCNENGYYQVELQSIVGHKKGKDAVTKEQAAFRYKGKTHYLRTTKGWRRCILWKDGSTSWERLSDLKESYPVGVDNKAAFNWWIPFVLQRKEGSLKQ